MEDVREAFLKYFERRGHTLVRSAPLVAKDDPTLLFVNAGMVPFKEYFTNKKPAPFRRATSSQRCLRVSGKHNDFENVGRTPRHHTFFEMLGNFSFGDYFKEEAIAFAWEFLTKELGLPKEKLFASVYVDDDEAYELWQKIAGLPQDRIVRLGKEHCFWAMGDFGPCGPCSEILIDLGASRSCGRPDCGVGCDCDRYLELWNLVFMSYDQGPSGGIAPLPKPSIDTGMGLERILSVVEGATSNYETSLFTPIRNALLGLLHKEPDLAKETSGTAFRVILDHSRAASFLVLDGVLPANEGHGYVLKRIIRRALRFGRMLGLTEPFLNRLILPVAGVYEKAYPELRAQLPAIQGIILKEEERFLETLERGLKLLEEEVAHMGSSGTLPGEAAFRLYDTFGFPLDLIDELLKEQKLGFDRAGFEAAMDQQRERARKKSAFGRSNLLASAKETAKPRESTFIGYNTLKSRARVLEVLRPSDADDEALVVFDETPFYPQGGGQLADRGEILAEGLLGHVQDVQRQDGSILHRVRPLKGELKEGMEVELKVDNVYRDALMRAHTGTHLLHSALRSVLGGHVRQAGSLVDADRLRFDFTHFAPLTSEQVKEVEGLAQKAILQDLPVRIDEASYQDALKRGALAFFGEKYADVVRVVEIPGASMELCGGTHVGRTGQIGPFRIVQESSIASDVRRIEAYVGLLALKHAQEEAWLIETIAATLKTTRGELLKSLEGVLGELDRQRRLNASLKRRLLNARAEELLAANQRFGDIPLVSGFLDGVDMQGLRELGLLLQERTPNSIAVLGAEHEGKGFLIVQTRGQSPKDGKPGARAILDALLARIGGKGGGREDFAQAGGLDPKALQSLLLEDLPEVLERLGLG